MSKQASKPNIVFVFSDQQRFDTLGCYGQTLPVTPALDKLAEKGVLFENAFSVQPLCGPARSCMQTGLYATRTGCHVNGLPLRESENNLASLLSKNGYKTGYTGKWHLAKGDESDELFITKPVPPEMRGGYKDMWVVSNALELTSDSYGGHLFDNDKKVFFNKYRVDAITDYALDFIEKYRQEPFFLTVSYLEPHHQNSTDSHECPKGWEKSFTDFTAPPDLIPGKGNWEKEFAKYLASCNSIDRNIKRITEKLADLGLEENTLFIYSSDHGSHFKTRPGEYKRSCHESSIRIPLIFSGHKFSGGIRMKGLATILDIPVTILGAAGITPPEDVDGLDLSEYLHDEDSKIRDDVFIQISESEAGRCIRTKRYKLHVSSPDNTKAFARSTDLYRHTYFYDLEKDPGEQANLINDARYKNIINDLTLRLKEHIFETERMDVKITPANLPGR